MDVFKTHIRDIPNFPKKGIIFKDITPVLSDAILFKKAIDIFRDKYEGENVQKVVAIESRGFIFGSALAYQLNSGFCIVRKSGKLPYKTIKKTFDLEYGTDTLEIHQDSIKRGQRVLIIDDLLATGGTAEATIHLVEELQGRVVGLAFLIELLALKGREKLKEQNVFSIVQY